MWNHESLASQVVLHTTRERRHDYSHGPMLPSWLTCLLVSDLDRAVEPISHPLRHSPPFLDFFLWRLSFISNYVYACVYMRRYEYSYPWRAAEGIRSSWSWSYRWSWAAGCERWNRTRDLCKINTHSQPLRHSYSSRSVNLFILLLSLPLESLLRLVSTF